MTIILLDHQNNYIDNSSMDEQYCKKNVDILAISLNVVIILIV